jgi:hypothetical protein
VHVQRIVTKTLHRNRHTRQLYVYCLQWWYCLLQVAIYTHACGVLQLSRICCIVSPWSWMLKDPKAKAILQRVQPLMGRTWETEPLKCLYVCFLASHFYTVQPHQFSEYAAAGPLTFKLHPLPPKTACYWPAVTAHEKISL